MKKSIIFTLIIAVLFISAGIAGIYYPSWTSLIKPDIVEILSISVLFFGAIWMLCGFVMISVEFNRLYWEPARLKNQVVCLQNQCTEYAELYNDSEIAYRRSENTLKKTAEAMVKYVSTNSMLRAELKTQTRLAASWKANHVKLSNQYSRINRMNDDLIKENAAFHIKNSAMRLKIKELNTGK